MENKVQPKNLVTMILISIFTCGIGALYWLYSLINDVCDLRGEEHTGGRDLILSIVTCGIYLIYLSYKLGTQIDEIKVQKGGVASNSGVIYLILSVVGLPIVVYALLQNTINEVC